MRIAFDLRRIGNLGVGRYMKCLVECMIDEAPQHEYILIMSPGTEHLIDVEGRARIILCSAKYYSVAEQIALPVILRRCGADLLHAPHFVVPLIRCCPTVVTIHDVIHFIYPQDVPSRIGRFYARMMMRVAARSADRILTVSSYSKNDIVRHLKVDAEKIHVAYPGADERFENVEHSLALAQMQRKIGIRGKYILYIGIYKQRKNHVGLLRAFALLAQANMEVELVIAGYLGEGEQVLRRAAAELGIADRVLFPGFIDEQDIPALYSGASVYACPSLYEGFGFTVLEAMACGVPVVSHNETSLPEVCGDAALFANARDPERFAAALRRAIEDTRLRSDLIRRGYDNVRRFSWTKAARQALDTYESVLHGAVPAASAHAAATSNFKITSHAHVQEERDESQLIRVD
jgi:glycosyltransferase involved in cell wall biosynthesis